jgi:hypothetical protein
MAENAVFRSKVLNKIYSWDFFEEYTNFEAHYLSPCRDIPLQSFGSHISPQPHGLGLTHLAITPLLYTWYMHKFQEDIFVIYMYIYVYAYIICAYACIVYICMYMCIYIYTHTPPHQTSTCWIWKFLILTVSNSGINTNMNGIKILIFFLAFWKNHYACLELSSYRSQLLPDRRGGRPESSLSLRTHGGGTPPPPGPGEGDVTTPYSRSKAGTTGTSLLRGSGGF